MELEPSRDAAVGDWLLYAADRAWWMVRLFLGHSCLVGVGLYSGVISAAQATAFTTYLIMLLGAILLLGVVGEWGSDAFERWKR